MDLVPDVSNDTPHNLLLHHPANFNHEYLIYFLGQAHYHKDMDHASSFSLILYFCRFNSDEILVNKVRDIVILMLKNNQWAGFLDGLNMLSDD